MLASPTAAPPTSAPFAVPKAILNSPLLINGGYCIYAGLPDPYTFDALYSEARELYPTARNQQSWESDTEEGRGGKPRRSLLTSTGGPIQDAWYASGHLRRFLSSQLGLAAVPSGNRGSYSYYARPADFLDLHRDVETCDVAVITVLHDTSDLADPGGGLTLYPGRIREPLSAIRERPQEGATLVKLAPGQTIVMFGGVVPHRLVPVAEAQLRIISVLCFRAIVD